MSASSGAAAKPKKHPFYSGLAGCAAGVCEISITMPLDTVKTRMQLGGGSASGTVRDILSAGGVRGFYAGYGAMLAQVSAKAGIRFLAYEQTKTALGKTGVLEGTSLDFVSGITAGIVEAGVWVTPTERIKVLQQAASKSERVSSTVAVRHLYAQQGIPGFFVGFSATALRQGSAMGIRFALFGKMKASLNDTFGKDHSVMGPALQSLAAGMGTGIVSSLANQPIDTAKSRIQAAKKGGDAYSGTLDCLRKMHANEGGLRSWYAGCGPRVLRLTIGQGVIFSCQEQISRAIHTAAGY